MTTAIRPALETGTLQMTRAQIDARAFRRWMGERRLQDPDHAMHCLLTECFGEFAPKPFRLILPRDGSNGVLYGYGRSDADAIREMAAVCADPLQSRVIPADALDSKPMPTSWRTDQRLGFEIRIRPVVRRSRNSSIRPEKECDAFLWEALKLPEGEMERSGRSREWVYADWLSGQMKSRGGARLEQAKLVSFQRTRAYRKQSARYSEGPDALMRGELTITDSEAFAALLARGVGRHRAYGFGMLLLRPAGRSA